MKKIILATAVFLIIATTVIVIMRPARASGTAVQEVTAPAPNLPILTHQQETWITALEWCESHGVQTAVNPKDRDGTPSYYSFQFKPGTFKSLGILYGVIPKDTTDAQIPELMKSYELQKRIVGFMVLDKKTKWEQQFPDCVKRKIGRPPFIK